MNKDKWSFVYVSILILFSCINILIYFNILPFDIWRLCNNVMLIITIIMLITDLFKHIL